MSTTETQATNPAATDPSKAPKIDIIKQFIGDLSFENLMAAKPLSGEIAPDVSVQANLGAKRLFDENMYACNTKLKVVMKDKNSDSVLFILEVDYIGHFRIQNIAEEHLYPALLIECPRITFPFLRRVVSDVTRDGGFAPLNLENIDFVKLFNDEVARRRAEANKAEEPVS